MGFGKLVKESLFNTKVPVTEVLFAIGITITVNGKTFIFCPLGIFKKLEDNMAFTRHIDFTEERGAK